MSEAEAKIEEVGANDEEDTEEHGDEGDQSLSTKRKAGEVTAQLLKNPEALAAIQDGLNSMVGRNSGYVKSLPAAVRRRIKALKKLQAEMTTIEAKFYEEFHALECKYSGLYAPLFSKRSQIANGKVEPTDAECEWPSDEEDDEKEGEDGDKKLSEDVDKVKLVGAEQKNGEKEEEPSKGIPEFWLTTFKSTDLIQEMIQEHDEPILRHLTDVQIEYVNNPAGFNILFHFDENDHFTNTVLTKSYILKFDPDPSDLLNYEGPEIVSCKGCTVDWKAGKNVTVKLIKKIQKHKGRGTKRTVTKTVPNDSFFNFFNPPEAPKDDDDSEDTESLLAADFEIGHYLRERVIPRAVLYFTGEAECDDYDDDEGDEEEEDSDDYNEDDDPDFVPGEGKQNPADCKQQ